MPAAYIEAVLVHELAHIRRHDAWVHAFQLLAEALLFYHPAVWWVSHRIREEREYCCDDLVVRELGDPLRYARALTELEDLRAEPATLGIAASGGSLMPRIRRLLIHSARGGREGQRASASLAATLVVCLGMIGASAWIAMAAGSAASDAISIPWMPEQLVRWATSFERAAEEHGVDAELLAIVAMVESAGDAEAESPTGAIGLMQVMPRTAAYIARERGIESFSVEMLRDPATNIDFGAWYLAQHLARFDHEPDDVRRVELAAAAYNGGPKQLRRHLEEGAPLSEETARYRALIGRLWRERRLPRSSAFEDWRRSNHRRLQ